MISFLEAQALIKANYQPPGLVKVKTAQALHRVLAQDIFAPIDLPPFDNSVVDGFAIDTTRVTSKAAYQVAYTQWAGADLREDSGSLGPVVKIMTGAPIPRGLDAVVMLEHARCKDGSIIFDDVPMPGVNVRYEGEDVRRGELVMQAGQRVTPQMIGVLLGLGIDEIVVYRSPTIKVICTGDELVVPGQKLQFGQVYFLVGEMLRAQAIRLGCDHVEVQLVGDSPGELMMALEQSSPFDLVLLTGGMSKGERDFVRPCLKKYGAEEIFYRGSWRPGMPLWFGKKKGSTVFGLPGNPVAVFVGFHLFVRAHILGSLGLHSELLPHRGIVQNSFEKKPGFSFFARARVNEFQELTILPQQGSHQVGGLSKANALCYLTAEQVAVKAKDIVHYYPI